VRVINEINCGSALLLLHPGITAC